MKGCRLKRDLHPLSSSFKTLSTTRDAIRRRGSDSSILWEPAHVEIFSLAWEKNASVAGNHAVKTV